MCHDPRSVVSGVVAGIISTLTALGTDFNLTSNAEYQAALTGLNQVETDVQSWTPGTAAQNAIQVLNDVSAAIGALKSLLPANAVTFAQTILAGIVGVIGTLEGNGVVPTGSTPAAHASDVMAHTLTQVKSIEPDFHYKKGLLGVFAGDARHQYVSFWNGKAEKAGYPQLKVA